MTLEARRDLVAIALRKYAVNQSSENPSSAEPNASISTSSPAGVGGESPVSAASGAASGQSSGLGLGYFGTLGLAGSCLALLLWADLHTKEMAREILQGHPAIPVISGFWNWQYAENRDVGFGLLRYIPENLRKPLIFTMVSIGILAIFIYGLRRLNRPLAAVGATLVLSGAIGNFVDRLSRGFVTDFIQWYYGTFYWPVFNLADVYVVVGVSLLLIFEWREGMQSEA